MRKNKLLLLLALLMTAATGAWATDVYVVGNGTGNWLNGAIWDPGVAGNKMTEQNGVYSITFTNVAANSESPLQFKFAINGTWDVTYGCISDTENELNKTLSNIDTSGGNNIMFGLTEPADVTISFNLSEMTYMISTKGMKVGDDASSGPKHLITATYDKQTRSLEQPLPYATTIGELFEAVTGEQFSNLISTMSGFDMPLTGISSNNTSAVSIGELNGASTPVTVIADGKATISINFGSYAHGIFVSVTSPLYANMKDGVKDADKWTVKVGEGQAQALPIGGLKGDGSETVTLQYNGRLKVKGVKATSEAPAAKTDLLSGVFSVSSTKKVNFSKGNLQATYNGTDWTWAFAENQWDYIGKAAGNTSINGDGTVSASNVTVDLFGWVGASSTWTGAAQYGISNSKATNNTNGYGNNASEALKSDWGNTISDGYTWFTLTSAEWTYLFNTRSASTVGGTANGRYAKAKVNNVQGVILFPDTYTHPDGVTAPTGVNTTNNTGWNGNSYDATAWAKMESAGCVFLPAAGYRSQASVDSAGSCGQYWSSSPWTSNASYAYYVYMYSAGLLPDRYGSRYNGNSVRLVQEVATNLK